MVLDAHNLEKKRKQIFFHFWNVDFFKLCIIGLPAHPCKRQLLKEIAGGERERQRKRTVVRNPRRLKYTNLKIMWGLQSSFFYFSINVLRLCIFSLALSVSLSYSQPLVTCTRCQSEIQVVRRPMTHASSEGAFNFWIFDTYISVWWI